MAARITKAKAIRGTKVIIVLIPCLPGWGVADNAAVRTARLAVETGVFPLFEVEGGLSYRMGETGKTRPIDEYLAQRKRFGHLSAAQIAQMQSDVDADWQRAAVRAAVSEP